MAVEVFWGVDDGDAVVVFGARDGGGARSAGAEDGGGAAEKRRRGEEGEGGHGVTCQCVIGWVMMGLGVVKKGMVVWG